MTWTKLKNGPASLKLTDYIVSLVDKPFENTGSIEAPTEFSLEVSRYQVN